MGIEKIYDERYDMRKELEIAESKESALIILGNEETKEKLYPDSNIVVIDTQAFDEEDGFTIVNNNFDEVRVRKDSPMAIVTVGGEEDVENDDMRLCECYLPDGFEQGESLHIFWNKGDSNG